MKYVIVLWAAGLLGPMGHDTSPRAYWHPKAIFETLKACHKFERLLPGHYAKETMCLRMARSRAISAVPQKERPTW